MATRIDRTVPKFLFPLVVSLSLILTLSCSPRFKYPLPAPEEFKADYTISGLWFRTTQNDRQQLSVFPRKDGWVDIVYIYDIDSKSSADGVNVLIFKGYTSSAKERKFLCFRLRKKDWPTLSDDTKDARAFLIVNYSVSKAGNLIVRHLSTEKISDLVNTGRLRGEVFKEDLTEGRLSDGVVVTSSSEELLNVIREEGPAAFLGDSESDVMVFRRTETH